jgi:outer membrane protein
MVSLVRASLIVTAFPMAALAADPGSPGMVPPAPPGWTITIGIEGRYLPSFDGSDRYVVQPYPIFSIRRAGTHARFKAPRDGFGIALVEVGSFRAGPVGNIRRGRDEDDDADLRGLGNIDWAFEVGGFAEYWWHPLLRTRAEVRQGFGGHHGVIADITADIAYPLSPNWLLSGGPRVTLASAAANDPYFSITPIQSLASGLPVYSAGGGVRSYGAGVQLRYRWSPQWAAHTYVEYERLAGDAGDSPLVTLRGSRDQVTVGVGVAYSFDIGGLGF